MKTPTDFSLSLFRPALGKVGRCGGVILAAWLFLGTPEAGWQSLSARAAEAGNKEEALTNASIIELRKLNLGDAVILEKIRNSRCDFDATISGIKQLKESGVSDVVIQAMIASKSPTPVPPAKPVATGDPNDPRAPHEPGVWVYEESGGQKKMTRLEAEIPQVFMGGGPFGSAIRAVIAGPRATVRASLRRPVFYMYFGEGAQGGIAGTTSPNELPLAKLDLKKNTQERMLVVGGAAPFGGVRWGIEKKSLQAVEIEQIAPGIYKATPKAELAVGEYGFCYVSGGVMGAGGKWFCFGIQSK